jgi:hypothetical protein
MSPGSSGVSVFASAHFMATDTANHPCAAATIACYGGVEVGTDIEEVVDSGEVVEASGTEVGDVDVGDDDDGGVRLVVDVVVVEDLVVVDSGREVVVGARVVGTVAPLDVGTGRVFVTELGGCGSGRTSTYRTKVATNTSVTATVERRNRPYFIPTARRRRLLSGPAT